MIGNPIKKTIESVIISAKEWIGTPFQYGCCERGKGTDCVRWLLRCLKEVGAIPLGYEPKHLPCDWFQFVPEKFTGDEFKEEILKWADPIGWDERKPGDIVTFRIDNVTCHIGLIIDDECFIHAIPYKTVKVQRLRSYKNADKAYRIKGLYYGC